MLSIHSIPKEWDYITLPKKANIDKIPKPSTTLKEDYFEAVKTMKYEMTPRILVFAIICASLTLMFGFLTVLVFKWGAYSAIFLIGLNLLAGFIFFISIKVDLYFFHKRKTQEEENCIREREMDLAKMQSEKIEYDEKIKMEYLYVDFVNSIRAMSKEIMTGIQPESNMQKFY